MAVFEAAFKSGVAAISAGLNGPFVSPFSFFVIAGRLRYWPPQRDVGLRFSKSWFCLNFWQRVFAKSFFRHLLRSPPTQPKCITAVFAATSDLV